MSLSDGIFFLYNYAMSIIFHIDVNSAFLSWTAVKLIREGYPVDIREVPAIVGGDPKTRHGIVVAKSIPAKRYGISTAEPVASAMRKCPNLLMVPPEHDYYSKQSRMLMEHLRAICPVIEQVSIDECYMLFDPICDKYASPLEAAHYIKDSVKEKFGFTVNVGISDRKILAKMASDFEKPDKVHTLYAAQIEEKMWPLPIGELHMCGKSASRKLEQMGVRTIGDLAKSDRTVIESWLKSHGGMLWEFANGIDESTVKPIREEVKGVGNSTTLASNVTTREGAIPVLKSLCESVSKRLKKKNFRANSICVEIKYADFHSVSHQKALVYSSNEIPDLLEAASELFDELWTGDAIRLLGVRTTKLEDEDEPQQMNLFEFQKQVESNEKTKKINSAMELINHKYGDGAIKRGFNND